MSIVFFLWLTDSSAPCLPRAVQEVKLTSPDYTDCDKDTALQDFLQRIDHYKACYQTIDEVEEAMLSFIKIFNAGGCRLAEAGRDGMCLDVARDGSAGAGCRDPRKTRWNGGEVG